jgi:hypothetical protein
MAKTKAEANFREAARQQEAKGAPLPTTPPEEPDTRPPLSPSAQARLDAEMKMGAQRVAETNEEHRRVRELALKVRANALEKGETSADDLS